jgi:hypothetical protein
MNTPLAQPTRKLRGKREEVRGRREEGEGREREPVSHERVHPEVPEDPSLRSR